MHISHGSFVCLLSSIKYNLFLLAPTNIWFFGFFGNKPRTEHFSHTSSPFFHPFDVPVPLYEVFWKISSSINVDNCFLFCCMAFWLYLSLRNARDLLCLSSDSHDRLPPLQSLFFQIVTRRSRLEIALIDLNWVSKPQRVLAVINKWSRPRNSF